MSCGHLFPQFLEGPVSNEKRIDGQATRSSPPSLSTRMRSLYVIVDSRCAIAMLVLPCARVCSDAWISRSVCVSRAEVASSKSRIAGFFRIARAMETKYKHASVKHKTNTPAATHLFVSLDTENKAKRHQLACRGSTRAKTYLLHSSAHLAPQQSCSTLTEAVRNCGSWKA